MNRFATLLIAILIGGSNVIAQVYKDPVAFGLRGPVKECEVITEQMSDPYDFRHIAFSSDGKLEKIDADHVSDIKRSSDGYLQSYIVTSEFLFFFTRVKNFVFQYKNGRLFRKQEFDEDEPDKRYVDTYEYDSDGFLLSDERGSIMVGDITDVIDRGKFLHSTLFLDNEYYDHLISYRILEVDDYGNYTSIQRGWYNLTSEKWVYDDEEIINRKITYYTGKTPSTNSPSSETTSSTNIVEPSRNLSIKDFVTKPLGVMPEKSSLWETDFEEVKQFVAKRSNWEISKYASSPTKLALYGNCPSGTKEPIGYDMTYRDEPVSVVFVDKAYKDPNICYYSYAFSRHIQGKIPQKSSYDKAKIIASPQWTLDMAIAFADKIVADLSDIGIYMKKAKNGKGDIYTRDAVDRGTKTYYKVHVLKREDDYSAFFSVILDIYSEHSWQGKEALYGK